MNININFISMDFACLFVCLSSHSFIVYLQFQRGTSITNVKKVKCTPVQALRLYTGRTAHRGSRGVALLFLDHGTRRGEGSVSRLGRSLLPGKDSVPIVQEAGWDPGPVWSGAENLAPHRDSIPGLSSP